MSEEDSQIKFTSTPRNLKILKNRNASMISRSSVDLLDSRDASELREADLSSNANYNKVKKNFDNITMIIDEVISVTDRLVSSYDSSPTSANVSRYQRDKKEVDDFLEYEKLFLDVRKSLTRNEEVVDEYLEKLRLHLSNVSKWPDFGKLAQSAALDLQSLKSAVNMSMSSINMSIKIALNSMSNNYSNNLENNPVADKKRLNAKNYKNFNKNNRFIKSMKQNTNSVKIEYREPKLMDLVLKCIIFIFCIFLGFFFENLLNLAKSNVQSGCPTPV